MTFLKKIKYVGLIIIDLSHQRTQSLSLSLSIIYIYIYIYLFIYLLVVVRKKSEGEDKVKNDAKQKKCMGTKNKYKI